MSDHSSPPSTPFLSFPCTPSPDPSSSKHAGPSSRPPRPNSNRGDQNPAAVGLQTNRGLATGMPERSAPFLARMKAAVDEAKARGDEVKKNWELAVREFWDEAKSLYNAGTHEVQGRDIRDLPAVATRINNTRDLDAVLAAVYADMPNRLKKHALLPAKFETAREAATQSVRSLPGADRDAEISKWQMFLLFGREITTTVNSVKDISALLRPSRKTDKISLSELTDRLWRKALADNANEEEYPEPTNAHLRALVRQLQEAKTAANEAAKAESERRAARREAEQQKRAEARGPRGRKRARDDDDEGDDDEEEGEAAGVGGGGLRPAKRRRMDKGKGKASAEDGGMADEDEDGNDGLGGDDEIEIGRGPSRGLEDLEEPLGAPNSLREIENWLGRANRGMRLLEAPADPDQILPDDVKKSFDALKMGFEALTSRLAGLKDQLS